MKFGIRLAGQTNCNACVQVLYGDVAGAMETWELLRALAQRHHGLIPEVYSRDLSARDLHYFLRYG
jgi:hypothetical protein